MKAKPNLLDFDKIWKKYRCESLIQYVEGKELFEHAVALSEGSLIVEVGSYQGKSSSIFAEVAKANKLRVICVDPLVEFCNGITTTTSETREIFIKGIVKKYKKQVTWIDAPTTEESSALVNEEIDYIFIDADHSYEGVMKDCVHWLSKLKSGNLVTLHDFNNVVKEGVQRAFKEYAPHWEEVSSVWNQRTFRKP